MRASQEEWDAGWQAMQIDENLSPRMPMQQVWQWRYEEGDHGPGGLQAQITALQSQIETMESQAKRVHPRPPSTPHPAQLLKNKQDPLRAAVMQQAKVPMGGGANR